MKKLSRLISILHSVTEGLFSQKKKQATRQLFSELSSTILPQMMRIKQTYGFFERELYIIKEHRKKESEKVMDTCALAERILETVRKNEAFFTPEIHSEYLAIQALELEIQELHASIEKGQGVYHIQLAEFDLKKRKLILVKSYTLFLKKTAKKAEVLYKNLEELFDFYPPFIDHLTENVLMVQHSGKGQKPAIISNR